jgi:hypothetical protein
MQLPPEGAVPLDELLIVQLAVLEALAELLGFALVLCDRSAKTSQ